MSQPEAAERPVLLDVHNVGGIDDVTVELSPGITVLTGRNATNRTSFLQAIMAACGSDDATLKADADEGRVELSVDGTTYTRRLERRNGTVVTDGDPYLDDPTLADLFAFLLESNEARRAVARGADLRELIMRPVDTAAIEAELDELEDERAAIAAELDELDELERELPDLEAERRKLEERIEEKRDELAAAEAEIDSLDADLEASRDGQAELEAKLEELREVRDDLETVRHRVDSQRESIDALEDERESVVADLEDYPSVPDERLAEIDDEVQRLRGRIQAIDSTVDQLSSVIQFNRDVLEDDGSDLVADLHDDDGTSDGDVTDRLVDDGTVTCWTCGSRVETGRIEDTLDRLRDLRSRRMDARADLQDEIDALEEDRIELEERRRQREQLEDRRRRIDEELDDRRERLAELTDRREELAAEVERLESAVEDRRIEDYDGILEAHREANQLEFELERLREDRDALEDEIERVEARLAERDELESRREDVQGEIEDLRTRVERLERNAVEEFNEHMDAVLDILEYDNLERIWIERAEEGVRDGRGAATRARFDLHVVRTTGSGSVYEDTVDHLSESEREVTGLVFALAGYLVHDVHEVVPFMLLDSVEALDSGRIARLVEYLEEYAAYLVVALLPEDAAALDDDYRRVTDL